MPSPHFTHQHLASPRTHSSPNLCTPQSWACSHSHGRPPHLSRCPSRNDPTGCEAWLWKTLSYKASSKLCVITIPPALLPTHSKTPPGPPPQPKPPVVRPLPPPPAVICTNHLFLLPNTPPSSPCTPLQANPLASRALLAWALEGHSHPLFQDEVHGLSHPCWGSHTFQPGLLQVDLGPRARIRLSCHLTFSSIPSLLLFPDSPQL